MEDGRKLLDTDGKRLGSGTEQIRTEKDRAQELRYIYSHSATVASTTLRLQAQSERSRSRERIYIPQLLCPVFFRSYLFGPRTQSFSVRIK